MPTIVPLELPAWKINPPLPEIIAGVPCIRYDLLEPQNPEEFERWKKNRSQYFSQISKIYIAHFGHGFFSSLEDEAKDKIWRLFSARELYGLPNGQLWNAIMGSSLRKNVGSKKFNVAIFPLEDADAGSAAVGEMIKMQTFGIYHTGFKPELDRKQIIFSHDSFSFFPGMDKADYNYLALGFKGVSSQKEKLYAQKLGDYIKHDSDFKDVSEMVYWEDIADRKGVDFINNVSNGMFMVGLLMTLVGLWSYFSIRMRFAVNIEKIWRTYLLLGVEKKYWLIIHTGFFLVISLFMAMLVLLIPQIIAFLLNYSFPARELTKYLFPVRSDIAIVVVSASLFALLVEIYNAYKGGKRLPHKV